MDSTKGSEIVKVSSNWTLRGGCSFQQALQLRDADPDIFLRYTYMCLSGLWCLNSTASFHHSQKKYMGIHIITGLLSHMHKTSFMTRLLKHQYNFLQQSLITLTDMAFKMDNVYECKTQFAFK